MVRIEWAQRFLGKGIREERHLRATIAEYRLSVAQMSETLSGYIPDKCSCEPPDRRHGIICQNWISIPKPLDLNTLPMLSFDGYAYSLIFGTKK